MKRIVLLASLLSSTALAQPAKLVARRSSTEYAVMGEGVLKTVDCHNNGSRATIVRTAHGSFLQFWDNDGEADGECELAVRPAPVRIVEHRPIRRGIATTTVSSR